MMALCGTTQAFGVAASEEVSRTGAEGDGHQWTLTRLTSLLAEVPGRRVYFEETHHSSLFKEPIRTKGTLTFIAPSRVEKHVLEPYEERYLADGDTLVVSSQAHGIERTISLDEYPPLRAFVEGFRAVLAGDWERLQQFYEVHLEGMQSGWVLSLHPLDQDLRERVSFIRYSGRDDIITSIEIRE